MSEEQKINEQRDLAYRICVGQIMENLVKANNFDAEKIGEQYAVYEVGTWFHDRSILKQVKEDVDTDYVDWEENYRVEIMLRMITTYRFTMCPMGYVKEVEEAYNRYIDQHPSHKQQFDEFFILLSRAYMKKMLALKEEYTLLDGPWWVRKKNHEDSNDGASVEVRAATAEDLAEIEAARRAREERQLKREEVH